MSLSELYYDPRKGLSSLVKFAAIAKKNGFSQKEVASFLAAQEVHQIHRERPKVSYFPNWGRGAGSYQIDLMFQDGTPILTIINVITRYVYAFVLKRKTGEEVLAALQNWLRTSREDPKFVQSDGGSEFLNKGVTAFFKKNNIERRIAKPGDHHGQGIVERFHGTLRRLFRLYEDAFKQPWKTGFDDLVYNYNHRIHRSIGVEPVNATEVQGMYQRRKQYDEAMKLESKFNIGDQVRKSVNRSTLFDKGKVRWSETVYTITGKNGHLFELNDGSQVLSHDLQRITSVEKYTNLKSLEPARVAAKAKKKVVRDLRKAGVNPANVTEEERKKQAPTAFVAEPAPNPRTLSRVRPAKSLKTKPPPDPTSVKIVEVREKGKYYFGRVGERLPNGNFVVNFNDGSEGEYSPADVLRLKWNPNAAQRARLKKDPTWTPI
jgi:transposase InsO family protein